MKNVVAGESIIFPPPQGTYFWVSSLCMLGHQVEGFIRNTPVLFGWRARSLDRFTGMSGLKTLSTALAFRFPRGHPNYWLRNRRLLAAVANVEPDVIFMTGDNHVIFPETLATIKARHGCKIVYASADSPIVFSGAD